MRSKIGRKVMGSYLTLAFLTGLVAAFAYWSITRVYASTRVMEQELRDLNLVMDVEAGFRALIARLNEVSRGSEGIQQEAIAMLMARIRASQANLALAPGHAKAVIADYEKRYEEKEEKILGRLESQLNLIESLTNEPAASPKVETAQFLGRIGAIAREVESAIEEFRRNDREEVQKAIDEAESTRRRSLVSFLTAVGVLFVLSVALSIRFTRGISHPIGILRAGAAKIREGDLAHRIDLKTGDELEEFSREFNQMAHRLEDVHRSQSELIEARTRQLVRSEKLAGIGTLAAGVAHEINNPLASVAGYAEALRRRAESPALRRCQDFGDFPKYLEVIAEETYRCKEIIGNLLDFSRQREPVFESVDLAASLQKTCDLLRHQSGMEKKRLEVCCTNGPLTVQGDETQLRHAFFNLLRNAAEAIEESGDVRVSAQERDGQVVIEIEDTGKGIAADDLPRVLEPFYTTKPPGKGTGLGLSVSYGIIQSHGGELEIHSDGAGRGCRVTVSLPMSSPPGKVET